MATNPLSGIRTYDPMTANAPKDATAPDNSPKAQTQNRTRPKPNQTKPTQPIFFEKASLF